jgi:hypothetical protein
MAIDSTAVQAVQDAAAVAAKELTQAESAAAAAEKGALEAHQAAAAAKTELGEVSSAMAALQKALSALRGTELSPAGDQVPTGRFRARYYDGVKFETFVAERLEDAIALNLTPIQTVIAGLTGETFSARWLGDFAFDDGAYCFTVTADDGVRLFIDDALVLEKWVDQSPTAYTVERPLKAGTHRIKVEYYQNGGMAVLDVKWAKSVSAPQPIDTSRWEHIWGDEFDYTGAPDPTRWAVVVNGTFQNRRENVRVENGALVLEVRKDNAEGQTYTSGSVRTADPNSLTYMGTYGIKRYFKPGRIEARIKIAPVRGLMNSFWLMSNWVSPGSAYDFYACGEIDVLEAVGYDTDNWYGTAHSHQWFDFPNGRRDRYSVVEHPTIAGLDDAYHVWAAEWDESAVKIFCDGKLIVTRNRAGDPTEKYWPFVYDMALVLECGHKPNAYTDWGGEQGTDDAKLPARMCVDYVRAFTNKA